MEENKNYKEYTVILKEYDGGGRNATSKCNEEFEELDWATVMYCVTEDVIEQTGMTLDQIFDTLRPYFN